VQVDVLPAPVIVAGPDTVVCYGGQIKLWCTEGESYLWTPATYLDVVFIPTPTSSPFSSISYIVYVTDASGCVGSDTVDIIVNAVPDIIASDDVIICRGDTTTLTVSGGVEYTWSPDPLIPCVDCSSVEVSPSTTTNYLVMGTDANGCSATDEVLVTVDICNSLENLWANTCTIYPNPTTGNVTITLPEGVSDVDVIVRTVSGELISHQALRQDNTIQLRIDSDVEQLLYITLVADKVQYTRPISLIRDK